MHTFDGQHDIAIHYTSTYALILEKSWSWLGHSLFVEQATLPLHNTHRVGHISCHTRPQKFPYLGLRGYPIQAIDVSLYKLKKVPYTSRKRCPIQGAKGALYRVQKVPYIGYRRESLQVVEMHELPQKIMLQRHMNFHKLSHRDT